MELIGRDLELLFFLQNDHHYGLVTHFLFPKSRRENVLAIGLYTWICLIGSLIVHLDLGSCIIAHVVE